ncbi:MAG: type II secretion system F family protein [Hyphomicrobiales bacterium]
MPKFSYQAITDTGAATKGEIEADSIESASSLVAARGYIPTQVRPSRAGAPALKLSAASGLFSRIKAPELILFSKQFKTLIRSGVPMLTILQVLEDQAENKRLKSVLGAIHQNIRDGASLYDAFRRHPEVFSPLYCSMLRAGESAGALPEILDRLVYVIEHEHKVKSDVKSAMTYPIIVLSFLAVAFFILLIGVIPKFVNIFKSAGLELPLPTKICLGLYHLIVQYWYILAVGVIGAGIALFLYSRTPQGRFVRDTLLLQIPLAGKLFQKAAISRFASIFSILQSSGVDILDSMDILSGTIGNEAISRQLDGLKDRLREGRGISTPLRQAKYFTPMLINMIAVGEESGNLDVLLRDVAMHYDTEVEYATKKLSDAVAPVLTISLAAVVGFFALAIFLPMWDLTLKVK